MIETSPVLPRYIVDSARVARLPLRLIATSRDGEREQRPAAHLVLLPWRYIAHLQRAASHTHGSFAVSRAAGRPFATSETWPIHPCTG